MKITSFGGIPVKKELKINAISSVNYYEYTPKFHFDGEYHADWELVYIDMGEVIIETDKEKFVLSSGQAFLHKPFELHKIRSNNCNCSVMIITFRLSSGKNTLIKMCGAVHNVSQNGMALIKNIIKEADVAFKNVNFYDKTVNYEPQFGVLQLINNYIENLLILFLRPCAQKNTDDGSNGNSIIKSTICYLKSHLSEPLTLEQLSKDIGYSQSYLSKLFRKHTNQSIVEYLLDLRIEEAKNLMAISNKNFNEISEQLGFSSVQYFSKMFKLKTGYTPSQYNKSLKIHNRYNIDRF